MTFANGTIQTSHVSNRSSGRNVKHDNSKLVTNAISISLQYKWRMPSLRVTKHRIR